MRFQLANVSLTSRRSRLTSDDRANWRSRRCELGAYLGCVLVGRFAMSMAAT